MFKVIEAQNNSGSILIPKISSKKIKVRLNKKLKIILTVLAIFFFACVVIITYVTLSLRQIYIKAGVVADNVRKMEDAVKEQDLGKIQSNLTVTKDSVNEFSLAFSKITWLDSSPFIGNYIKDGERILVSANVGMDAGNLIIKTIEPYADLIGLKAGSSESQTASETTQDRIDFIIKTLPYLLPVTDELSQKMSVIKSEIDQIDPLRYPQEFRGLKLREMVNAGKDMVDLGANVIVRGKPLLEVAPYLLGVDSSRTYLVLFQNDKELRPTGGFITAYTIAKVENGKFEPVSSSDIYNLDEFYKPRVTAPDPIIKYLKGPYLLNSNYRLRDINWSPDFATSMELFLKEASTVGIKNVDGVIAVDTQLLVNILDVLGPVGVPGFGEYSTKIEPKCNCPQVIYELESFADIEGPVVWSQNEPGKIVFAPPNYDNRKKIIGPLMNSILANTLGQSKEKIPSLFKAAFNSAIDKHILIYMADEKAENALKTFGIAGSVDNSDADYLSIIDANLGGRKSNLYVTQEVEQEVKIAKDGSVEKSVSVTYKNPAAYDGWLNSVLPNWVRVYVPKGSQLMSFDGAETKADPYEDLGKTVFAGYFQLRPQGIAKITLTYKLPFKVSGEYNLLLQKQPGTDAPLYTLKVGKYNEEFNLTTDKQFNIKI